MSKKFSLQNLNGVTQDDEKKCSLDNMNCCSDDKKDTIKSNASDKKNNVVKEKK